MYYYKILLDDTDKVLTVYASDIMNVLMQLDVSESHIIAIIRQ